jgi:arsenate reductase
MLDKKLKILFLCTGNSCRSQMAEGWAKHLKGDAIKAYSAGLETHGLNPTTVQVMQEEGVNISTYRSKHLNELTNIAFDVVITVCDSANEQCPLFSGEAKVIHHGFDDPPALAKGLTDAEALQIYRRVRDEIRLFVEAMPNNLNIYALERAT